MSDHLVAFLFAELRDNPSERDDGLITGLGPPPGVEGSRTFIEYRGETHPPNPVHVAARVDMTGR